MLAPSWKFGTVSFCVFQEESAVAIVSDRITHRVFNEALVGFVSCILDIVSVIMIVRNWLSCFGSKNSFEFVFLCFDICLQCGVVLTRRLMFSRTFPSLIGYVNTAFTN
jgi:hypothetical protein